MRTRQERWKLENPQLENSQPKRFEIAPERAKGQPGLQRRSRQRFQVEYTRRGGYLNAISALEAMWVPGRLSEPREEGALSRARAAVRGAARERGLEGLRPRLAGLQEAV